MMKSYLKFDWESINKIQDIFNKHNIEYNYIKLMKNLESTIGNRYVNWKDFIDDYCDDYSIKWKHCKGFKEILGKNAKAVDSNTEIISIEGGFVEWIYIPKKDIVLDTVTNELLVYDGDSEQVGDIADIEKFIVENEKRLKTIAKFRSNKKVDEIVKQMKNNVKALAKEKEKYDIINSKYKQNLNQILSLCSDFD